MECKTQRLIEEERATTTMMIESRKEKRKAMKKMKRKQTRKETALKEREQQEARLNDPQFLMEMTIIEQEEAQRSERARKEFDEREAAWLIHKQKQQQEEAEQQRGIKSLEDEQQQQQQQIEKANEDDHGEYVEDGPAEVIWQGNEIIVKKKRVKVLKKNTDGQRRKEDDDRPTSNPLPPQSEVFADYNNASLSAQQLIETVAQRVPHFGTEQDKAHCPFHLKTGACRFGQRCSRVHFYPDKSSTLLIKNMYNGPGLAWEQDEGLEYTDEEVDLCYEEFYEDVHTEFLKFGEIINFKVCRNGAFHLRGNVYIQYSALDAAVLAQQSINGRYFAGKQISCEFINVTRWKVAICGEYMKSRYKTCSRGTACNFIHCFRNPGGDYEWADSDRPPPKYWVEKTVALFGYSDAYEKQMMEDNPRQLRNNGKMSMTGSARSGSRRSSSRERSYTSFTGSGRRYDDENYSGYWGRTGEDKHAEQCQENSNTKDSHYRKSRKYYTESDGELEKGGDLKRGHGRTRKISRPGNRDYKQKTYETESDETEYDGHLSDRGQNKLTKHGSTRKSSKRHGKAYREKLHGDYKQKTYETESDETEYDGHLSDRGQNKLTKHGSTRKSSKRHGKAYREKLHGVDKDSSTRDKERDLYSRQKRKVGCADNHKVSKNRAHDSEGEWSDSHRKGDEHQSLRKSLWHIGDDFLDEDAGIDACHARKRSKHWDKVSDKSHGDRAPAHDLKHHGDHLSLKEADFLTKDLRSHGTHEPSNLDRHDLRCLSNVQIDNQDRWKPETGSAEMYHNSNRKAGSSESYESGRPGERDGTDEFDLKLYYGDEVGKADHYKSEKVTCSKHQKSRRKSMESDHNLDKRKRSQGSSAEQTECSEGNEKTRSKRKKHRSRDHKHGRPQE